MQRKGGLPDKQNKQSNTTKTNTPKPRNTTRNQNEAPKVKRWNMLSLAWLSVLLPQHTVPTHSDLPFFHDVSPACIPCFWSKAVFTSSLVSSTFFNCPTISKICMWSGSCSETKCSATACAATFSLRRTISYRLGSKTSNPSQEGSCWTSFFCQTLR